MTSTTPTQAIPPLTPRSRLTLKCAAAITGADPWANGYSTYYGTFRTLTARLQSIRRAHGGNLVSRLLHRGRELSSEEIFDLETLVQMQAGI